ncbi:MULTISPECIES: hypothetical protein [Bacillus]|uniref:hypothetical protein n=1 Tax=Bacillus TaxID=1386 RepID=UPI000303C82A|nr:MULTISPECIES: hypothetical protein [Bacillus]
MIKKQSMILLGLFVFLLLFFFLLIFSFQHIFPRSYHHLITKNTDLHNERVEGIHLNENINDKKITARYGEISGESRDVVDYNYYMLREGLEIATDKQGMITRFIVTDKHLATARGIKLGDSKNDVIKNYGKNYYNRFEQGMNIVGYIDKKKQKTIEFWMIDNKVAFYRFDFISME